MSRLSSFLFACAFAACALAAAAQPEDRRGPTLVAPEDGAVVDRQVTVRIGFSGSTPHGPAEGTGIDWNAAPHDWNADKSADRRPGRGPSDDAGITMDRHPHGPHYAMLIDAPMPQPGTPFKADAQHVAFPVGIPQMIVILPPGQHQLTLLRLNDEGSVSRRFSAGESTTITVKQ